MQTVEEFMSEYFIEKNNLFRIYEILSVSLDPSLYTKEYLLEKMSRHKSIGGDEEGAGTKILGTTHRGTQVEVFTAEISYGRQIHYKYFLSKLDMKWIISRVFEECWMCKDYAGEFEHSCEDGWTLVDYCI